MEHREIDLGYLLLDAELVDVNGRRCGKVDDLELDGAPGEPTRLSAILSGTGLWVDRLPRRLRSVGARLFPEPVLGKNVVRVPWEAIDSVTAVVNLREPAPELGLGRGDDELAPLIERLPKST
jgi:sporulation protein YlmC with PRC-barrel domain